MKKLPNFLLIGVPKAGTTSLYYWLKQHPEIFMSPVKEPHYFSQIGNKDHITSWDNYTRLFDDVKNEKAIGEASTSYFHFYHNSIPMIKGKLGKKIKILVILRNPIERAWSHYQYYLKLGREHNPPERVFIKEYLCLNEPWKVANPYLEFSYYSKPLKIWLEEFGENFKVFFYEDLRDNPQQFIEDIYKFLEVNTSFFPNFEVRNVSGKPKNKIIANLLSMPWAQRVVPYVPLFIKQPMRKLLLKRENIPDKIKDQLKEIFYEDIIETSKILKKDLSNWLEL